MNKKEGMAVWDSQMDGWRCTDATTVCFDGEISRGLQPTGQEKSAFNDFGLAND